MHILLTNDDGPPSNQSSPYIHSLADTLQKAGHTVSVVLPNTQRSWIGKAHMVGQTLTPSYFRPGTLHKDDGITQDRPFNDGGEEWILLDGTPASCTQIGLWHLFNDRGPVDVIVSGPNYGRNTTAVFALSSGTLGAAMEGATMGKKSIAISYAFDSRDHDPEIIAAASRVSTKLVEKFVKEWPEDVHVYSINVPLRKGVEEQLITYTHMIQNKWSSGSSFAVLKEGANDADPDIEELKIRDKEQTNAADNPPTYRDHVTFKWSPNFADVRNSALAAGKGDGWHVMQGHVTVTPLRANFWHLPNYTGEIKLDDAAASHPELEKSRALAIVQYPESYVQPLIVSALNNSKSIRFDVVEDEVTLHHPERPCVQFKAYEALDFEHAMQYNTTSQICAYVIRKALIRKHYLSNTIAAWLTKHPMSILRHHFKASVHFELDYAEFLDDALVDAWDLHESMARNEEQAGNKEWWILKPGMSDGGNGIRLFSSIEELQQIFEEWDPPSDDEDKDSAEDANETLNELKLGNEHDEALMTSQLRHFIVQPYIDQPLMLPTYNNRKFHIRSYVLAIGALRVFVYREMLALFAAKPYEPPGRHNDETEIDLSQHLTNTCFQDESTKESSVHRFWSLNESTQSEGWHEDVFSQICGITGEVFEAAAREQMVHFQAIPNAFEIFGVDFLVDSERNVWLLEMNAYPDFKQTGEGLQDKVVGGLFDQVVNTAVAPFFGATEQANGSEQMVLVKEVDLGRR
ncbi:putative tubulin--tyrosine ligase pby1 [Knufia obscura]|uniref:Tubulin--tyrosine ligase pby1 n=1 Tax=Knufia obscura TaxID=1635080 RepID=A0ABR0RDH2_9EURO|nr:putative tubulin--tyrosine ligase pby1 [Knufia obscura]